MPIYEFRCPDGHTFERFQRMGDPPPEKCEICGKGPLEIVLHPVAVHFKGPGFYSTDYGKGGRKREPSKDGDSKSSPSSDSSGGDKSSSGETKKAAEA
jgi:putative FmdB family regulatory protein